MNIKQHIEAGHYPTDSKGRALVPTKSGDTATIYATDCPGDQCGTPQPIAGYEDGAQTWGADGLFDPNRPGSGHDLLPPPPRKVEVRKWGLVRGDGVFFGPWDTETNAAIFRRDRPNYHLVELTGSYEEPWS